MTEREKIVDVLRDNCEHELRYYPDDNYTEVVIDYEAIADALIEAGIGDVSAVKAEQEEIKLFNASIKNGEIDMTIGGAGLNTFFALIVQIFKQNGASAFFTSTIECENDIKYALTIQRVGEKSPAEELRQATKLWKHEEHRAEVAEKDLEKHKRAFDKAIKLAYKIRTDFDTLSCSSCEFGYAIDACKKIGLYDDCENRWKEELLQQAERELAEEGKDG